MEQYPMAVVTAPGRVEFKKRTLPPFGSHDVLLRVKACSICGGDLHIYKGKHPLAPLPMAIGHEISGEVIETGKAVSKVSLGDRVAVEPVITCGTCYFCIRGEYHLCENIGYQYSSGQGGFTPYFVVSENWVHLLPDFISFEEGALFEPLAVAVHACCKAQVELGHSTAIFGAGGIGLFLLQVVKAAGGSEVFIVDLLEHRLKTALSLGAHFSINVAEEDPVERIIKETHGLGVDRSFEAVGVEKTLRQSAESLKKGGICVLIGLFEEPHRVLFPVNLFVQREIQIRGCRGYCWDFQVALELVRDGKVQLKPLISHQLPLSDLRKAFEILLDAKAQANKVIIQL
ncbi:MAG: alcohol dehydrogenase catalytic domain-containing protein [Deltaproteobacteria bacterium]|nr:alcohol dehydrogenase catalytic domain-containing protein [Deltaproteobacteria bacterium]